MLRTLGTVLNFAGERLHDAITWVINRPVRWSNNDPVPTNVWYIDIPSWTFNYYKPAPTDAGYDKDAPDNAKGFVAVFLVAWVVIFVGCAVAAFS